MELVHDGNIEHDLTVDELDAEQVVERIAGGETQTGTVQLDGGECTFYCSVSSHCQAGMETNHGGRHLVSNLAGQSPRRRRSPVATMRWGLLAALLAAVGVGGCGSEPAGTAEAPAVLAELCAAQPAELQQAEERFWQVHGRLHELAADVEARDRAVAAELLEAKRAVEEALAEPHQAREGLAGELERLVTAVRDALAALDRPAPRCDHEQAKPWSGAVG